MIENRPQTPRRISVVITVKNDPAGIALALESLGVQTRMPDEIVIVDGGSIDGTMQTIRDCKTKLPMLRVIEAPGANIAAGRNRGVREAIGEIIATTDSGCRADPQWLARLIQPFEDDPATEFVAGFYRVIGVTPLERVIGLSTMRGQLDDLRPESFNPSARSMALTKDLWERAGGWPQWVNYSEDTLFDQHVRRLGAKWVLAPDAVVDWRPRGSLRALARQFYFYGTGRGQTGIDAAGYRYNIRNLSLVAASIPLWPLHGGTIALTAALLLYFGWWAHHAHAQRVAGREGTRGAYGRCVVVMNVVTVAGALGYIAGWWRQRHRGGQTKLAPGGQFALTEQPA